MCDLNWAWNDQTTFGIEFEIVSIPLSLSSSSEFAFFLSLQFRCQYRILTFHKISRQFIRCAHSVTKYLRNEKAEFHSKVHALKRSFIHVSMIMKKETKQKIKRKIAPQRIEWINFRKEWPYGQKNRSVVIRKQWMVVRFGWQRVHRTRKRLVRDGWSICSLCSHPESSSNDNNSK